MQTSNPHPREGLTNQIPHYPGTENTQMSGVCSGEGTVLKFPFDRRIISMIIIENRKDDNFETYDFLWILWISFWANG